MRPITAEEPCVGTLPRIADVRHERFDQLGQGRRVIHSWFERGWRGRDNPESECFEPFIFTWIALNGWAECVTDLDRRDQDWVQSIAAEPDLAAVFHSLLSEDPVINEAAVEFTRFWPIPRLQALRRRAELMNSWHSNAQATETFARAGVDLGPRCAFRHQVRHEGIPLDWSHFLWALYRARCNLFHGEKNPYHWGDQAVIARGFKVLVHAMSRWRAFEQR